MDTSIATPEEPKGEKHYSLSCLDLQLIGTFQVGCLRS